MDTDITQPTLSPVGTVWVVTELIVWVHWGPPLDAIQSYILRIYLGPTPFQSLSLLTTVNWGATECCGKTFIREYSDLGRLPQIKEQIIEMSLNGSGIRDIARVLKISPNTVY
jgi:hypothetical protein